ncbi:MAG: tetratricopeptide repeat protein, partial [Melioribacteraceae bacterium]|nr:tetratricopeptide repeat protein [Melioribacteraceae bacterium]
MTNKLQNTFLIPIILLTFLLNGCGVWEDFTTFFNTYYNAGKTFDLAMEEIEKLEADKFEFKQKPLGGNLKQNLELVIEKCSKILQFHQESSYFDDALYMIGIAFYYQGDYSKGLRKFHELASVEDSDLQLENKLWIAKCELQLRNFDQGFNRLEDLKTEALEAEEKEIVEKALITQIGYLIYRENYLTAINYLNNLMEVSESDELRAETAFQQGKIYLVLNEQENAAAAFQSVMDYSPTFDVEFSSQFEYAKLQKELNKDSLSLDLLNDLRDENKFDEFRHKIELEIGLLYYEQGKIEDALDKFRLVDTVYTKTESSGIAAFMRGEIWEKHYKNYDSAFYFYDRTSASQAPKEVKDEAREKNNVINDYFTLNEKYMANAKQYVYLVDPEKFIRDSLDYEAAVSFDSTLAAKSDSTDEEGNLTTGGDRRNTFGNRDKRTPTGGNKGSGQPGNGRTKAIKQLTQPKRPTLTLDSLNSIIAKNKFELGNLFFSELEVPDSAFYYYSSVLNDYDSTD